MPINGGMYSSESSGEIVDPDTLQFRRAITSEEQGYSVCTRLKQDSIGRNQKNAAIAEKYNDGQPYNQAKLSAAKQDWRRNASSGFLSSMVKRILPPYNQVIDSAKYLTQARFKNQDPNSEDQNQKQEDFRFEATKCMRGWDGWQSFKTQLILENVLYGYTGVAHTDKYTWEPIFLRQDEAYFPDGCPQEARLCPLWCYDQNFLIHELAELLINPKASETAGWNIENLVKSINSAKPENRNSGTNTDLRKQEDLIRETSVGTSYSQGVKVIKGVHLFAQEASGKVSHYLFDDRNKDLLMKVLDQFENMTECLSFCTIEPGNGKLHGSKGAGRILYNTHVSVDQARNLIVDNLYLSGLLILKKSENAKPQQALTVVHPIAIIGNGYEVVTQKFEVNVEAFMAIDRQMTAIAEIQVGAFLPRSDFESGGEKPTAAQVNYVASIEQQIRESNLARFYSQFQQVVWECQKRIFSIDNIRKAKKIYAKEKAGAVKRFTQGMVNLYKAMGEAITGQFEIEKPDPLSNSAITACVNLLTKGLEPKEIYELGQAPSFELTEDSAKDLSFALDAVKAQYTGNPNVDQFKLDKKHIASKVGNAMAEELIIPQEDNTIAAEATGKQIVELVMMMQGQDMPLSPRDFDAVHLQVIKQKASEILKDPTGLTPEIIPNIQMVITHAEGHIQQAIQKAGGDDSAFQEDIQFLKQARDLVGAATEAQAVLAASPAAQPGAMPPAALGMPTETDVNIALPEGSQVDPRLADPAFAAQNIPLSRGKVPQI